MFLGEYDRDPEEPNHDRVEELQRHNETRWSKVGFVIIDDSLTEKTGDEIPNVGKFYNHAECEYIWGQDLVYTYYTDEKTGYPLDVRLYEEDNTKINQAKDTI